MSVGPKGAPMSTTDLLEEVERITDGIAATVRRRDEALPHEQWTAELQRPFDGWDVSGIGATEYEALDHLVRTLRRRA
jgi:hypothetical protein